MRSSVSHNPLFRPIRRGAASLLGLAWGFGLLAGIGSLARAQEAPKVSAPITAKDYVIGIDDVIIIRAIGHDEISQEAQVLSDGKIQVIGVKEAIRAEGLTLAQLKDTVFKELDKLYNNLILSVAIKESHSKNVTIIGARASGLYPLRPGMRISTLIAAAGGPPPVRLKLVTGSLVRDFKIIKLDILKLVGADPDPAIDLPLKPNDQVQLDVKEEPPPPSFSVIGSVAKQGTFAMPLDGTPVTLTEAIAQAQGQAEKAALARVALLRKGQRIPLNLYPLLVEGKADAPEAKITMQDGDVLLFPETQSKFMVLGQVNHPSAFPLPETEKVNILQALAEAGGPTQQGNLGRASIVRMVNGKPTSLPIDIQKMIKKADLAKNILMQDGDVLYIPEKGHAFSITDVLNPFFLLGGLGFRPFR